MCSDDNLSVFVFYFISQCIFYLDINPICLLFPGVIPTDEKMRQKVVGGVPKLVQNPPNAPGETLSETNNAPMAFSLNQSSAVCLPLFSDSQSFIWVHSNEINLQLEGVAELDKAFDHFPYLTMEQTAALAKRCSLQPDQVKMWFMVQRLRYGISWDYKDIHTVRWKLRGMGNGVNKDRGENEKIKRDVKESGGKKEQSANNGRMNEENEREQTLKKGMDRKVEEGNTQKKRKRMTVMEKMRKKKKKQEKESVVERAEEMRSDERVCEKSSQTETTLFTRKKKKKQDSVVERAEEEETRSDERECEKSSQTETTFFTKKKKKAKKRLRFVEEWATHESFVAPDEPLDASPLFVPLSQSFDELPPLADNQTVVLQRGDDANPPTTPVESAEGESEMEAQLEEEEDENLHVETTNHNDAVPDVRDGSPTIATHLEDPHVVDAGTPPAWMRSCNTKTQTQLATMKVAFSHCQYPEREDYDQLALVIDIPRYVLVRWWGDMRYYIKKVRPRWMNAEQHRRALANIRYRQYLKALKLQPQMVDSEEEEDENLADVADESCGEEEDVPVPTE